MRQVSLIKCPTCGRVANKPVKSLKNCCFQIEAYKCDVCGHRFKMASETFFGYSTEYGVLV